MLALEPVTALPETPESDSVSEPERTATAPPADAATLPSKSEPETSAVGGTVAGAEHPA